VLKAPLNSNQPTPAITVVLSVLGYFSQFHSLHETAENENIAVMKWKLLYWGWFFHHIFKSRVFRGCYPLAAL